MKYQAYPAYKDSGVEWLGKIPEEWEVFSLRNAFTLIRNGCSFDQTTSVAANLVRVTRIETISDGIINYEKTGEVEFTIEIQRYRLIQGDISFSNINSLSVIGNVAMKEDDAELYAGMNLLQMRPSEKQYPKYLLWMFRDALFRGTVEANAKPAINQASIPVSKLAGLPIPKLPLPTQQAIVAFLDTETARIDGLIKDYEELIVLLQEKQQALISHAVTRGLSELVSPNDPDFGAWVKPVKFRDSGVEWLGEIPEGWGVPALGYHYEVQLGKMLDAAQITGSQLYPYLRNQDVQWGKIKLEELPEMDFSESDRQKFSLRSGDLLVCEGGDVGRAAVWLHDEIPCFYQKALHRIRPHNSTESDPRYLLFILMMANRNGIFVGGEEKATIYHLTADRLRKFRLPFPKNKEQSAIAAFLDKETAKMDTLVTEAESVIELLKEHRSALITNAVTGKINVEGLV